MPRANEYKRVREGLIFADVGKVYVDLFVKMVEADHSDKTKFLRWLIQEEWNRRVPPIGTGIKGAEKVPVYGVKGEVKA